MRKFIEEHEKETLLILVTILGISRWWLPGVTGFEKMYAASHWVLSYDYGLIRRGLIGTILKIWAPVVTITDIYNAALVGYCMFAGLVLGAVYFFIRYKDKEGRLFRLILLFIVCPATIPLIARNLGRFDLFLTTIAFLCMALLSLRRYVLLIPVLMTIAVFIHEGFMILYAPTILGGILLVYFRDRKDKHALTAFLLSAVFTVAAFIFLYRYGSPTVGYEEFSHAVQSRAAFNITPLSMSECYYNIKDHYNLASSSLYDAGSIANFFLALIIISPVVLVLLNLWQHALDICMTGRNFCKLFFLCTLTGLLLVPVATDYGRWLSAVILCNLFAVFFFISSGIIRVRELTEYSSRTFRPLFVMILLMYLLFGPFNDWNPYPYKDNPVVSSLSVIIALLFDIGFCIQWVTLKKAKNGRR